MRQAEKRDKPDQGATETEVQLTANKVTLQL
jgi:hypothetical protein